MNKIKKWRELSVNPFDISFKYLKLEKLVSFPYAQNDVVETVCNYNGIKKSVIIKIERSSMADFEAEINNLKFLSTMKTDLPFPQLLEEGTINSKRYIVLNKIKGERLSKIFEKETNEIIRDDYLRKYGETLAKIHNIKIKDFRKAKQRIINNYPKYSDYKYDDKFLASYIEFLKNNAPKKRFNTFIHGDFHYANLLWENGKVSGILDWEYGGAGFKEQDIAWSIILRPGQEFMNNLKDINTFLEGYLKFGNYNKKYLKWCLVNGICHFYLMNLDNYVYIDSLKKILLSVFENW